jgi:hypothetical protein
MPLLFTAAESATVILSVKDGPTIRLGIESARELRRGSLASVK